MRLTLSLLLLIAAIAGAFVLFRKSEGAVPSSAPEHRADADPAPRESGALPESGPLRENAAHRGGDADRAGLRRTLRGRVAPAPGAPLFGARIGVWKGKPTDRPGGLQSLLDLSATVRSGADPDFMLELDGDPLATAEVGSDGSFEVDVTAGPHLRLDLLDRFHGFSSPFPVHCAEGERVVDVGTLETYAGGYIVGQLIGADAEALAGGDSEVLLTGDPDPLQVVTDPSGFLASIRLTARRPTTLEPSGRFEYRAVPPRPTLRLSWESGPQYAEQTGLGIQAGETVETVLVAKTAAGLRVRVLLPDGTPATQARVSAEPFETMGSIDRATARRFGAADDDGIVEFTGLTPGRAVVQASCSGWLGVRTETELSSGVVAAVRLDLLAGTTLSGHVVDSDGQPIHEARVKAIKSAPMPMFGDVTALAGAENLALSAESSRFRTDEEGRFEIRGLADGDFTLVAVHPDYAPTLVSEIATGSDDAEIVLERPAIVVGRVVVEGSGDVVDKFRVRVQSSVLFVFDRTIALADVEDPQGRFELGNLPPGRYGLTVESDRYGVVEASIRLRPEETSDAGILELPQTASVAGRVLDTDGQPVAGAAVYPRKGGILDDPVFATFFSGTPPQRTDEHGSFQIDGLVAKRGVTLRASANEYASGDSSRLELIPGRVLTGVEIRLGQGARVVGRLLVPPTSTPRDWRILATKQPFGGSRTASVDVAGNFELKALDPGDWDVQAMNASALRELQASAGRSTAPGELPDLTKLIQVAAEISIGTRVSVSAGEVEEIEIDATDLAASTEGIELEASVRVGGEILDSGIVEVIDEQSAVTFGTVANGILRLSGLEPGRIELKIRRTMTTVVGEVSVLVPALGPGSVHRTAIELPAGGIAGRVLGNDGTPQRGVIVRLTSADDEPAKRLSSLGRFTLTDPDGGFAFEGLSAGMYGLHADTSASPSSGSASLTGLKLEAGERLGDLTLFAGSGAVLTVSVLGDRGQTLAEAFVLLVDAAGRPVAGMPGAVADAEGVVRLAGLPETDPVWILVRAPGFAPGVAGPMRLEASGLALSREVRLTRGTPVAVRALDATGNDLAASSVRVRIPDGPWLPTSIVPRRRDGQAIDLGLLPSGDIVFEVADGDLRFEAQRRVPTASRARFVLTP